MNTRSQTFSVLIFSGCILLSGLALADPVEVETLRRQAVTEGWTFAVSDNPATQYTIDELCGLKEPPDWKLTARWDPMEPSTKAVIPSAFDWRDYDGCTPVRNQGGCGSCWAFATVGALECAIKIREGVSVDLSEQWLNSCNTSGWGCDGGWYAHSYHGWLTDPCGGTGAVLESDFPYNGTDGPCGCPHEHHYTLADWAYIGTSSSVAGRDAIKRAIIEYGPVSVSVYVSSPFHWYDEGIYNYCDQGEINHSVVLVGWDDDQGQSGVWIMRNSWGPGWGEGGYMRIEYSCAQIGYAACYVDYKPIIVTCNTEFGPAPLAVDFQSEAPGTTITGYLWDFGDGQTSTEAHPSHTYVAPGCYTVELTLSTPEGDLTKTCHSLISAHGGSMRGEIVEVETGGDLDLDVIAYNPLELNEITIPFSWAGPFGLTYDSFTVAGTRASHFNTTIPLSMDRTNQRGTIFLRSDGAPLPVGEGRVATLWFTAPEVVSGANPIAFVSYSKYAPEFVSGDDGFEPLLTDGLFHTGLSIGCCEGMVGDVNMSGDDRPTIGDVSALIDNIFISGVNLECLEEADVNQSGGQYPGYSDLTIGDVSLLIEHLFISAEPLPDCF